VPYSESSIEVEGMSTHRKIVTEVGLDRTWYRMECGHIWKQPRYVKLPVQSWCFWCREKGFVSKFERGKGWMKKLRRVSNG
jgi:hypothetical protein